MKKSTEAFGGATLLLLSTATLAVVALAASHPTAAAAIGSTELGVLGVPQLVKNFREKAAAARDVSLESTLIWFFVASLLCMTSWIRQSSGWYILMNAAGVAQSAVMLLQINAYARPAGALAKTAAAWTIMLIVGFLALTGVGFSGAGWAYLLFPVAMGLLIVMNVPQIIKNYELYQRQGSAPNGITPLYPIVVVTGSSFHLIAALKFRDSFWAFNSAVSVAQASLILGQILLPDETNAVLGQLVGLKKSWISIWA